MANAAEAEQLLWMIFEGWTGARHEVDSFYLAVQDDPQWKAKFQRHFNDPFRKQMTDERLEPLKKAIKAILNGAEPLATLEKTRAAFQKAPN